MRRISLISLSAGLIIFVLLIAYTSQRGTQFLPFHTTPSKPPNVRPQTEPPLNSTEWVFDPSRDARNRGLSRQQCDATFPALWQELDRAKNWHLTNKQGRLLDKHDIDQYDGRAQLRLMIYNGQLRILDDYALSGPHIPDRPLASLQAINRAINAIPDPTIIPNIEFTIDTQDDALGGGRNATIWSYCRPSDNEGTWVMPDFGFWSYPTRTVGSYDEFLDNVHAVDDKVEFVKKKNVMVWRGSPSVGGDIRSALVNAAEGFDWGREVKFLKWGDESTTLDMHEHCRFRFAAHTEGITWSGRLRYLQNCNNVVVSHKLKYIAHYYPLLTNSGPDQNFVEVERDYSDLSEKMQVLLDQPELAARIAENGKRVFRDRYLTPAAEACYWRKMFEAWSEVQGWETQGWEVEGGKKRMRGVAYEQYAVTGKNWGENAPP